MRLRLLSANVGVIYGGKPSNFCLDWVKAVRMAKFPNSIDGNKLLTAFKTNKIFMETTWTPKSKTMYAPPPHPPIYDLPYL